MWHEKFPHSCCVTIFALHLWMKKTTPLLTLVASDAKMKRLHLLYIYGLLALLTAAMPASAASAEASHESQPSRIEHRHRPAAPLPEQPVARRVRVDSLRGMLGQYLMLKLVPFDRNNNFVIDTVSRLHERIFGPLENPDDSLMQQRYIAINPRYFRLFIPMTYFRSAFDDCSRLPRLGDPLHAADSVRQNVTVTLNDTLHATPFRPLTLHNSRTLEQQVDGALMSVYLSRPDLVVFTQDEIDAIPEFAEDLDAEEKTARRRTRRTVANSLDLEPAPVIEQEAAVDIKKPNWWTVSGNGSLQTSQLYLSDNWYKGGESSISMLATFQVSANYNDQEKVQWENLLDAKLGIASTPSDTVHDFLANTDQLRIYSKLGIQASKHWYYTVSAEFKTQFVHGYKSNNPTMISAFFAPADLTVAVGMDYKRKRSESYTFSLFLAPLNWTMRYVGNHDVDETTYGLTAGKTVKHNLGSEIQPTISWNITKNITFDSRLDYLTSYRWIRVEWENTLNMALTRFLSTKVYVHARYDDSSAPISGNSHFQLSELLSFGINYKW